MYHDRSACVLWVMAATIARGCGVEATVRVRSRRPWAMPSCQATPPPQSWPTTWKVSRPAASASASTSRAKVSRR